MLMILLLLSITAEDAPAAAAVDAVTPATRCENASTQSVDAQPAGAVTLRPLSQESLANAYRPVVRDVACDRPVVVARRVGQQQR
ncbi:hypothetical protein [Sphingomonas trueperi]|uniref:hypothetical protein n=1 Tax=Sphingomonas trueperi TaxID=53317 RepID=UPI000EAD8337